MPIIAQLCRRSLNPSGWCGTMVRMQPTRSRVWRTALVGTVGTILVSSIGPELATERYAAGNLLAHIPGGGYAGPIIRIATILTLASAVFWGLRRIAMVRRESPNVTLAAPWLGFAFVWALVALLPLGVSQPTRGAWISMAAVVSVALIEIPRGEERYVRSVMLAALRVIVLGSLALGFVAHDRSFAPYAVWPGGWFSGSDRLQGLMPHPNTLAWITAVAIICELVWGGRRIRLFVLPLAIWALVLTGSRTATIALFVGVMALAALVLLRRATTTSRLVAGLLTTGVVFTVLTFLVTSASELGSFNGRSKDWIYAFQGFLERPVVGQGPGAYVGGGASTLAYAHGQILQTAVDLGTVGLVALVVHGVLLIRAVRRGASPAMGSALVAMWFAEMLTESVLRFASVNFVLQIVVIQLALLTAGATSLDVRRAPDVGPRSAGEHSTRGTVRGQPTLVSRGIRK